MNLICEGGNLVVRVPGAMKGLNERTSSNQIRRKPLGKGLTELIVAPSGFVIYLSVLR